MRRRKNWFFQRFSWSTDFHTFRDATHNFSGAPYLQFFDEHLSQFNLTEISWEIHFFGFFFFCNFSMCTERFSKHLKGFAKGEKLRGQEVRDPQQFSAGHTIWVFYLSLNQNSLSNSKIIGVTSWIKWVKTGARCRGGTLKRRSWKIRPRDVMALILTQRSDIVGKLSHTKNDFTSHRRWSEFYIVVYILARRPTSLKSAAISWILDTQRCTRRLFTCIASTCFIPSRLFPDM